MRLVFMGTPDFALPSLRSLLHAGHEIVSVVTQPDRPRRRQSAPPAPSPVKAEAERRALPVVQPVSIREPGFAERLRSLAPETIVVVAYGQILPPDVLRVAPRWCINLHASILPRYRGAAPIARAILAGEKVTGVTTMKMDQGLDTGDILLQKEIAIGLDETAGALTGRLADLGAAVLVETLALHAHRALEPRRQDGREATQAPPLTKEDGRIDWLQGAQAVACRVRACNPWPLAFTFLRGEPLQILRAEVSFEASQGVQAQGGRARVHAGRVVDLDARRILVDCGAGPRLAVLELRFAGRKAMSPGDAVNGRLVRPGETFTHAPH